MHSRAVSRSVVTLYVMSGRLMSYSKSKSKKSWCLQKALIMAKIRLKKETKAILATLKEKGRRDSILGGRYNEWVQ